MYIEKNKVKESGAMAKKGGAPENLKPVRTKEEAKARGRNGGKKSGEARRRKRDAKAAAKLILDLPCTKNLQRNLNALSIEEEDYTNRVALMARAFSQAMTGDTRAMEFLIKTAGETPEQRIADKRFKIDQDKAISSNNAVDDWIDSIPDIEVEDEQE